MASVAPVKPHEWHYHSPMHNKLRACAHAEGLPMVLYDQALHAIIAFSVASVKPHEWHYHSPMHKLRARARARMAYLWCCTTRLCMPS